ncbi:MAG: bifunctional diaminohydroxyphosphoribosylaminopyrimidine deaminase/5-amino-6-(5-phosphoribosylamino)uracil reductase RibD [Planctomycetota bacterium]|jgi:diaminohydroxyphosphoribosylaminopyrimidine deaminase/5-amino-6-(5-phosphoribosylamino)uracil reductase
MADHERYMRRCLELALRGEGKVEPNPLVGAVVVRGGRVAGEAAHRRFGGPHAEPQALKKAGKRAKGATLYVNMEPCAPHPKKTPPCTDAVLRSGVRHVVAAMLDPNPAVRGRGVKLLRGGGVRVKVGVLKKEAQELNAAFLKFHTRRLPYVIAKWAMTLDGKIATHTGDSKWITSERSRALAKRELRSRVQAVLVGSGTALRDDPMLDATKGSPARIVLDSKARLPITSNIVRTAAKQRTIVVASAKAPADRVRALEGRGCEVIREEVMDLKVILGVLAEEGLQKILIEGGSEIHGAAMAAGLVDEVWVFVAPRVVGGKKAKTPVAGPGVERIADALSIGDLTVERIGGDVLLRGKVRG